MNTLNQRKIRRVKPKFAKGPWQFTIQQTYEGLSKVDKRRQITKCHFALEKRKGDEECDDFAFADTVQEAKEKYTNQKEKCSADYQAFLNSQEPPAVQDREEAQMREIEKAMKHVVVSDPHTTTSRGARVFARWSVIIVSNQLMFILVTVCYRTWRRHLIWKPMVSSLVRLGLLRSQEIPASSSQRQTA